MSEKSGYSLKRQLQKAAQKAATDAVVIIKQATDNLDILEPDMVGGVDTDFWLGNWEPCSAKACGAKFAFIRAGQGLGIDNQFRHSWTESFGLLYRGAYWYLTKAVSNDGQARLFASLFPQGYNGELPLVVDMEEDIWRGKGKDKTHLDMSDCDAFVTALKKYMPNWDGRYILYSGYYWLLDHGGLNPKYREVPLWYSNPPPYLYKDAREYPRMGKLWKPTFIQFSFAGDGLLYGGKEKGIDLDFYCGTFDEMCDQFKLGCDNAV